MKYRWRLTCFFNLDRLPLPKSSRGEFWPILILIRSASLRTGVTFRNRIENKYHIRKLRTSLKLFPKDMEKSIPYDYMHLVLLGVTKILTTFWTNK